MTKIIAEVCQNHLGNKEILREMIKKSAEAGADYVKGQIIFSEDLTFRERFEDGLIESNGVTKTIRRPYQAEFDRLKKLDLTDDDYKWFVEECTKNNVTPMLTVFSRRRVELAARLPWTEKIVKVASYDCASYKLISELCDVFDHLVISVGATFDEEIAKTADLVKQKGKKATFLHCVTSYPNSLEMCNLARINWLRKFSEQTGWSDHTNVERDGLKAAKVAALLGADMIERHFTTLRRDETKDGPVSINPEQLMELKEFCSLAQEEKKVIVESEIPDWQKMIGSETRELTYKEILNRDYYRGRFASFINGRWVYNWEDLN